MRPLYFLLLFLFPYLLAAQSEDQVLQERIYFPPQKSELGPEGQKTLDQLTERLKNKVLLQVLITGHSDSSGRLEINEQLSVSRARAVRHYLLGKRIPTHKLTVEHSGSREPLARNNTEASRASNRRVEVKVLFREAPAATAKASPEPAMDAKDWLREGEPLRDTVYFGKQGTAVIVPRDLFGATPIREVNFALQESYNLTSMLTNELNTMAADGTVLETGGMVTFSTKRNSKKISAEAGKQMEVWIPAKNPDPEMELYVQGDAKSGWSKQAGTVEIRERDGVKYYVVNSQFANRINLDKYARGSGTVADPYAWEKGTSNKGALVRTWGRKHRVNFVYGRNIITTGQKRRGKLQQMPEFESKKVPRVMGVYYEGRTKYLLNRSVKRLKYDEDRNLYTLRKKDYRRIKLRKDKSDLEQFFDQIL